MSEIESMSFGPGKRVHDQSDEITCIAIDCRLTKRLFKKVNPSFFLFQMTWLKMRTKPYETGFPTWKKGFMIKMMKLPVYVLHWPMHYDVSILWNQQKVRYLKRDGTITP